VTLLGVLLLLVGVLAQWPNRAKAINDREVTG
jgi:hypothetical protein